MGNAVGYICSFCSKKFSRKWNAKRHNNDIHKGLSSIDYRLKKGIITLNKPSSKITRDYATITKVKQFDRNFENKKYPYSLSLSPFRSFNNNQFKKKSYKSIFYMDEQEKEDYLYRKLEQMSVPFEKLEKLFVEAPYLIMPLNNIQGVLSNIVITALGKPDPVIYIQNKLALYTRLYCSNKLISCVARNMNMDVTTAKEYLKNILSSK
jgi:hypothetical protein